MQRLSMCLNATLYKLLDSFMLFRCLADVHFLQLIKYIYLITAVVDNSGPMIRKGEEDMWSSTMNKNYIK